MSLQSPEITIFAGPTLRDLDELPSAGILVQWLPPVRRGDIAAHARSGSPGRLAVVDGVFHQSLAVGHAELRVALEAGWEIWGLSSLGAIRACEMAPWGMRGYGQVFDHFARDESFRDDEVALLHDPSPPYRPASEPLVHMRAALDDLVARQLLVRRAAEVIVDELMGRWFGERTLPFFRELVLGSAPADAHPAIHRLLGDFGSRYRIKSHDLRDFLATRPWRTAGDDPSRNGAVRAS
jgi:hypothetical protein